MFETARKYSEFSYYTKKDLEKELDYHLVEPVWNEIVRYRDLFRQDFPLSKKPTYLVRSPYVNDQIMHTQEQILAYILKKKDLPFALHHTVQGSVLQKWEWESICIRLYYDKGCNSKQILHQLMELFQMQEHISYQSFVYLCDASHPLILKLFLMCYEWDIHSITVFLPVILHIHHASVLFHACDLSLLASSIKKQTAELDVTKDLLSFLLALQLQISQNMIPLNTDEELLSNMQEQELIQRFPMLFKGQILFYVHHRELYHYYTLQDYMQFNDVCYETARTAMEKLVDMKWYQKKKTGKKFVYYIA